MPFLYPYQPERKKEFTFKECEELGLKKWQCPPVQFGIVAGILLIGVVIVASLVVLTPLAIILILLTFGSLMVIAAYIIVRHYNKYFEK